MSATSEDGVSADALFLAQLNNGSSRVWSTPTFRPKREQAAETILLSSEECGGKLIVIDRTRLGKSHILCMVALFVGGIVLVIVPLLSLTADQMAKIRVTLQVEGSVDAHHLDEIQTSLLRELIIPQMHEIGYDSTSTMFLLTSPQNPVTTSSLLEALFMCHQKQTLRSVTINGAHLFAQHGQLFQESLRVLINHILRCYISSRVLASPLSCNDGYHDPRSATVFQYYHECRLVFAPSSNVVPMA